MTKKERIYRVKDFKKIMMQIWKAGPATTVLNLILKIIQAILPIQILFLTKQLVDLITHVKTIDRNAIVGVIIWLLMIQIVNAIVTQLSNYFSSLQQQLVTDYLSQAVIKKAIEVELAYYENPEYHNTLHLAQHQAIYKSPMVVGNINQLIESTFSIVVLSALFFTLGWIYAVSLLIIAIPIIAIRWYNGKSTYALEKKSAELERQSGYLNHVLTSEVHAKEVRAFGFGTTFLKRFTEIRKRLYREMKTLNKRQSIAGFIAQLIEIIVICLMYLRLALETLAGVITIGGFILYFQAFQRLQSSLKSWLQTVVQLYQSQLFLGDIFAFLDLPSFKTSDTTVPDDPKTKWNTLTVSNLSFRYPNTEKMVLRDLSLSCKSGEVIAIVGENGSGKSTLVKLLCRLYPFEKGQIRVGEQELRKIPEEEFREHVSVVFQDFGKYYTSVTDNIQLGFKEKTDPEKIVQSAKSAGAHAFIESMPLGYKTILGRSFINSEELSGGQWQKLAVARAFYRSSDILILDEPTSHIDPIAEYTLIEEIKEKFREKIVVFITHRLHHLKIADQIYVMKEGRIAEHGTFNELAKNGGTFSEMYRKQQL
ncbi:MAG: ABC transporter ATP-binding protein [Bacteroidota bacterium]|nr:ABC transporter ATP-binding protein [Bacteroidota bacterium]